MTLSGGVILAGGFNRVEEDSLPSSDRAAIENVFNKDGFIDSTSSIDFSTSNGDDTSVISLPDRQRDVSIVDRQRDVLVEQVEAVGEETQSTSRAVEVKSENISFTPIEVGLGLNEIGSNGAVADNVRQRDGIALERADFFSISYSEVDGTTSYFRFSVLPAIETTLRGNHQGQTVPEVKPGILLHTKMNMKKMNVPGGSSVYQSLGIDQTILQMNGLFVGSEGTGTSTNPESLLYGANGANGFQAQGLNGVESSKRFLEDVVYSASPVDVTIQAGEVALNYRCLIQGFRIFAARENRAYYAIDALVLTKTPKRLKSSLAESAREVSQPEEAVEIDSSDGIDERELRELRRIYNESPDNLEQVAIDLGIIEEGNFEGLSDEARQNVIEDISNRFKEIPVERRDASPIARQSNSNIQEIANLYFTKDTLEALIELGLIDNKDQYIDASSDQQRALRSEALAIFNEAGVDID